MRNLPLALLAALTLAGCNPRDAGELKEDVTRLGKTATRSLSNAGLAGKVNGVLSVWKGIDMSGFRVEAENDTVTLDGTVRNAAEKRRILEVVKQVRGVEKVVDKLRVE